MINIENTSKSYKGKLAVDGLSLSGYRKEKYMDYLDRTAGKSTTLNMLLGFLKPDSGTTLFDNINTGTNAKEAREIIGYIPENVNPIPI